jgi:hypothetical protein
MSLFWLQCGDLNILDWGVITRFKISFSLDRMDAASDAVIARMLVCNYEINGFVPMST